MNGIVPDIPRAYTALAEWGACLLYILLMRHRLRGWKMALSALIALIVQTAFLTLTSELPIIFWIPSMITAIIFMFIFIFFSCDISAKDAGFFCIRAFVLAEFAASFESQIYWFFWPEDTAPFLARTGMLIGIYLIVGVLVWILEKRHISPDLKLSVQQHELWSAVLIGAVIFLISNMSFVSLKTPFSGQYPPDVLNIRTMVDLGGFAILYAHHMQIYQMRARRELEAMDNILKSQYLQYKQSRESIDLINRKYHDLKHQIAGLRVEQDPKKREAWLDEMENDIKTYEAQNKTGNTVLDTLLTGKGLYCKKHDIGFTCVADGTLLNFMDTMDVCTIFGNALDNAIECEKQISDKEKRMIHITVSKQKEFLLLRFENYFEGQLQFESGLPITTKKDVDYHGYGLKNIRLTAQKYGGEVTVNIRDKWFELRVIIPI